MKFDTSPEGIAAIIRRGETDQVEFKRRLPPESRLAQLLSAFANTSGGLLLIGVQDARHVGGLSEDEVGPALTTLGRVAASMFPHAIEVGAVEVLKRPIVYAVIDPAPAHLRPIVTARGEAFKRTDLQVESFGVPTPVPRSDTADGRRLSVFVAMSFHEEEEPALVDYFKAMERAVAKTRLPIDLRRVDLVEGDYEISQRIMEEIDAADVVIADFTLSPRNVYFELGYARGRRRHVIQTARKGTPLEFDVRNWRTHFYRNATELEQQLEGALVQAHADVLRGAS